MNTYTVSVHYDVGDLKGCYDFATDLDAARANAEEQSRGYCVAVIETAPASAIIEVWFDGRLIRSMVPAWLLMGNPPAKKNSGVEDAEQEDTEQGTL